VTDSILRGTIAYIDDEYRDMTCELVSSNRPEKYKRGNCYAIKWDDIVDCRELWLTMHNDSEFLQQLKVIHFPVL
jgi:hypothetical protein